ncbi:hypothetical protein K469DRAFT_7336 [Zopfia rhizophila CBS 207.26]|uniref:DUF572-domain-containing protein n=1 Tax=Zopfia rhizophila CBS 207.26 TaxID=1314779 RepID=A0A6A6EUN8_9PEZI|nr:hypothetical protein K469DRAFT_7336 [Zopfia rhizophila CBS 207.26]
MSEHKGPPNNYPPNFDHSALCHKHQGINKLPTARLSLPFALRCTRCGEYIYRGRRFNTRKQTTSESYTSIYIFRFYIKRMGCSGDMSFQADPRMRVIWLRAERGGYNQETRGKMRRMMNRGFGGC